MIVSRWTAAEVDLAAQEEVRQSVGCSRLFASLLVVRGLRDGESAQHFLSPKLRHLSDPFGLPDMERAVARIEGGVRRGENIAVFGDYDVDGVASTCLVLEFFRLLGYPVAYRLPHRIEEGYGLRASTVRELAGRGVRLLITVDNGSSARSEIELARELGMDVVVVDHHQPSHPLPEPAAHVNPWLAADAGTFRELAGAGVTFKLLWALSQHFSRAKKLSAEFRDFLLDCLALVALGTIADVVPLRGENRVLASFGLAALESAERPGLRELVRTALSGGEGRLDARKVGFRLGPRLNAAGRLGNAELALEVLTTRCPDEARRLVGRLERENERRKKIEDEIHRCARARVLEGCDLSREHAIVLGDTSWHPGVIGIVAARLCEEFHRPTFLVAINGERGRGSARSVHNVHISNALARCSAQLVGFGGHALAAGFEVERGKLDLLRAALNDSIDAPLSEMSPKDRFDGEVSLTDLTPQLLGELERLAPFGSGNPQPLFAARDLNVVGRTRRMGNDGRHLAFFVRGPRSSPSPVLRAVAFGCGSSCDDLQREGARVSLVFEPRWNHWQGRKEIELEVHDLRTEATEATEGAVTSASRGRCAAPRT